jgi:hypothetical protein
MLTLALYDGADVAERKRQLRIQMNGGDPNVHMNNMLADTICATDLSNLEKPFIGLTIDQLLVATPIKYSAIGVDCKWAAERKYKQNLDAATTTMQSDEARRKLIMFYLGTANYPSVRIARWRLEELLEERERIDQNDKYFNDVSGFPLVKRQYTLSRSVSTECMECLFTEIGKAFTTVPLELSTIRTPQMMACSGKDKPLKLAYLRSFIDVCYQSKCVVQSTGLNSLVQITATRDAAAILNIITRNYDATIDHPKNYAEVQMQLQNAKVGRCSEYAATTFINGWCLDPDYTVYTGMFTKFNTMIQGWGICRAS